VPWINRVRRLADATVADIPIFVGYEISYASAAGAKARIASLGLESARVFITPNGVDVITLIAVLKHMTESERASLLTEVWAMMASWHRLSNDVTERLLQAGTV
jgi:hypothetical protein